MTTHRSPSTAIAAGSHDNLVAAARCITLDLATASVVQRLHAAGVTPLLLKGPALARLLYDTTEFRAYSDIDLLVSPDEWALAEETLGAAGFRRPDWDKWPLDHHRVWVRRDDAAVLIELHRSFHGLRADERAVWRELSRGSSRVLVGGAEIDVPSLAVGALLVALHAGGHGREAARPLHELERAVERLPYDVWADAAAVAARLDATGAMALGMRLHPRGAALASRLGLQPARSVDLLLHANGASSAIAKVAQVRGPIGKSRVAARVAFPTPAQMRRLHRIGERDRLALARAYALRALRLPRKAVEAVAICLRLAARSRPTGSPS